MIAGLQKLNRTLTNSLKRFEGALTGIDLYVYYPSAGTEFDEMWHQVWQEDTDEESDYNNKRITECIVPGIAKKSKDGGEDDVIIPAEVKVAE